MSRTELARLDGDRLEWLDLLRGVSILLVLVWHASAVPALFDWQIPEWLRMSNNALLPFRMPMLMFLSGLLLPRSLTKSRLQYYLGKTRTLVWPYFIWVAIYLTQYDVPWPITHWRTWYASGYLWFLFFITVYYFIAPLVVLLPQWLTPWLFIFLSIPLAAGTEKKLLYFAAFFFFGYWYASNPSLRGAMRGWVIPVVASVAIVWTVLSFMYGKELAYRGQFALFSICGIIFATWLAARAQGRLVQPLLFVGRNSVVYYVAHFPIMTLVTMAWIQIDPDRSPYITVVNFVVSILVVTALALARQFRAFNALFVMPAFLSNTLRSGLVHLLDLLRMSVSPLRKCAHRRISGSQ